MGMGEIFLLGILRGCPKGLQNTLLTNTEGPQEIYNFPSP